MRVAGTRASRCMCLLARQDAKHIENLCDGSKVRVVAHLLDLARAVKQVCVVPEFTMNCSSSVSPCMHTAVHRVSCLCKERTVNLWHKYNTNHHK